MWIARKIAVGAMVLGACSTTNAASQNPDDGSGKPAAAQNAAAGETMAQGDEQMSVAEAARLAKANKKDATTKVAKKYDDDKYQVSALPTYVLIGRDGQEIKRYEGEDPAVSIVERIAADLKNAMEAK